MIVYLLLQTVFLFSWVNAQIITYYSPTGKINGAINSVTTQITWQIKPTIGTDYIQFIVQTLRVPQGSVYLYDSAYVREGTYVWKCVSCNYLIPPTFYSTSGSVTLSATGTTGVTFIPSFFTIQYVAIPLKLSDLSTDIAVSLYAGYDNITPYNVNGKIRANSVQQWTIQQATNTTVTIMFSSFGLISDCGDILQIFDGSVSNGKLIFQGCSAQDKPKYWLYSKSGTTTVRLVTGNSTSTASFALSYYTNVQLYNCGSFLSPDLLTGATMLLSDGNGGGLMKRGISCSWLLQPFTPGSISLTFNSVSLKYGSNVKVYDSTQANGVVLWYGDGATLTVPPIITSRNNSLFISYYSDTSDPIRYTGFQGEYMVNNMDSIGNGRGYSTLAMSSILDIVPPGDRNTKVSSGCNYTWYVQPSQITSTILFAISDIQMNPVRGQLYLYDGIYTSSGKMPSGVVNGGSSSNAMAMATATGVLLADYTGENIEYEYDYWITTTSKTATLIYLSKDNTSTSQSSLSSSSASSTASSSFSSSDSNYFQMAYFAEGPNYHCGFIRNPAILTMFSWIITDGSSGRESFYANQLCMWKIQPRHAEAIGVFFTRYFMIGGSLSIYLGDIRENRLYTIINQTVKAIPAALSIPSSIITIVYTSSGTQNNNGGLIGNGFALTYHRIIHNDYLHSLPGNHITKLFSSSQTGISLSHPKSIASTMATVLASSIRPRVVLTPNMTHTWILQPTNSMGNLYLAFSYLTFPPCSMGALTLYYGNTTNTLRKMHTFCDTPEFARPYPWISIPAHTVMLTLHTNTSFPRTSSDNVPVTADFELSYYSDGPNYRCGYTTNPGILTAPSMIVTDGSASTESMYPNQHCQWIIQPLFPSSSSSAFSSSSLLSATTSSSFAIVLEMLENDLFGGKLTIRAIHPTTAQLDDVLWECIDCTELPPPIIVRNQFVHFSFSTRDSSSTEETSFGNGFKLVYWTIANDTTTSAVTSTVTSAVSGRDDTTMSAAEHTPKSSMNIVTDYNPDHVLMTVLEQPKEYVFSLQDVKNTSAAYVLDTTTMDAGKSATLSYYPTYTILAVDSIPEGNLWDGRSSLPPIEQANFASMSREVISLCGVVKNPPLSMSTTTKKFYQNTFTSPSLQYTMTQTLSSFLLSTAEEKKSYTLSPSYTTTPTNTPSTAPSTVPSTSSTSNTNVTFVPASICQYRFQSDQNQAIHLSIQMKVTDASSAGRLRVYSGVYGEEFLFFDSWKRENSLVGQYSQPVNFTLPCGKGIVMIQQDTNEIDFGFSIDYSVKENDIKERSCNAYKLSLLPPEKIVDRYIPYYISAGVIVAFGGMIAFLIFLLKRKLQYGYYLYPVGGFTIGKYFVLYARKQQRAATFSNKLPHRYYTKCINYLLPTGECCICKVDSVKVIPLTCGHRICLDDTKGYLLSALGDISMFPIKCPMHYEGCTHLLDAMVAKRILNQMQYDKFIEFSDRAMYGEGMRCIFCSQYVCFPSNSKVARVECPYCARCFCIRCKQSWHYGTQRCPVDQIDDSLENWKAISGAQKCPCCAKLIEKDDPDTCNHMVHKITDSIPCIRERTDFCYLCGEEVSPDYPHEEVKRKGVNHFPEGVFQRCRKVIQQEKDAERQQLRKQRRYRAGGGGSARTMTTPGNTATVAPGLDELDDEWNAWEEAFAATGTGTGMGLGANVPTTPNTRGTAATAPVSPITPIVNNINTTTNTATIAVPARATTPSILATPVTVLMTPGSTRNTLTPSTSSRRNNTANTTAATTATNTAAAYLPMSTSARSTRSLIFEEGEGDSMLRTLQQQQQPPTSSTSDWLLGRNQETVSVELGSPLNATRRGSNSSLPLQNNPSSPTLITVPLTARHSDTMMMSPSTSSARSTSSVTSSSNTPPLMANQSSRSSSSNSSSRRRNTTTMTQQAPSPGALNLTSNTRDRLLAGSARLQQQRTQAAAAVNGSDQSKLI